MDVVVIGGGPAGMMAAGMAAGLGARVRLVERNEKLGKKLYITGKGRCHKGFVPRRHRGLFGKIRLQD
jgi:predicted flavoprotein YhiN